MLALRTKHINKTGHVLVWNQVRFIDHEPHWYTRRLKKPSKKDFILIKLTETMKPKLPKHEMPTNKTAQRLTANKAVGIEQFSIQCRWYNSRLLWIYLTFSCALGCLLGFTLGPNKRLLIFSFALIGCYVYIDFGIKRALIMRIKIH